MVVKRVYVCTGIQESESQWMNEFKYLYCCMYCLFVWLWIEKEKKIVEWIIFFPEQKKNRMKKFNESILFCHCCWCLFFIFIFIFVYMVWISVLWNFIFKKKICVFSLVLFLCVRVLAMSGSYFSIKKKFLNKWTKLNGLIYQIWIAKKKNIWNTDGRL